MANTTIQILRSYINSEPTSLDDGELAYSFVSNTLFIGDKFGDAIQIGGPEYISNATINKIDGGNF